MILITLLLVLKVTFGKVDHIDNTCLYHADKSMNTNTIAKLPNESLLLPKHCSMDASQSNITCDINCNHDMDKTLSDLKAAGFVNATTLIFVIDIPMPGIFPLDVQEIMDISRLRYFVHLDTLVFRSGGEQNIAVPLTYKNDTFQNLTSMRTLTINIPLDRIDLFHMVRPMRDLRILDLSDTKTLGYDQALRVMQALTRNISQLFLRHFQTIGADGFSTVLDTPSFFNEMLINLSDLDLSRNGFGLAYPGLYPKTPNLRFLDLSHNIFTYDNNSPFLYEVTLHPNIEVLNIGHQGYSNEERTFRLETQQVKHSASKPFSSSKYFNFVNIALFKCADHFLDGNISNLFQQTERSRQMFCDIFRHCIKHSWMNFSCEVLPSPNDIVDFDCMCLIKLPIGQRLRKISFDNNFLEPIAYQGFQISGKVCLWDSSLEVLDYSGNSYWVNNLLYAESANNQLTFSGMPNFTEIDVSRNNFKTYLHNVETDFQLKRFYAASNRIEFLKGTRLCNKNGHHTLEELDLSFNGIESGNITYIIEECQRLQVLNLTGNLIDSNVSISLSGADSLREIILVKNNISTIGPSFSKELDKTHKNGITVKLDIYGNPLTCGCDSLPFVAWVTERRDNVINGFDTLRCTGNNGQTLLIRDLDITQLRNHCYNVIPIAATIAVCVGLTLTIMLLKCIHRNRFRFKRKLCKLSQLVCRGEGNDFEKDAFVAYCHEDSSFVHKVLLKELEDVYGFDLVIHHRDFPACGAIVDITEEFMRKSRDIIIVISNKALSKHHWNNEVLMAHNHAIEYHKNIILITLEELHSDHEIYSTINTLIRNHTHLKWKDNESAKKLFWARLVDDLSHDTCACCRGRANVGYRDIHEATEGEVTHLNRSSVV